jgi:hypothetical protein
MAKKDKKLGVAKTSKSPELAKRLIEEYHEADQVLTTRIQDKRFGFDSMDKLYNAYIDPARWPYNVKLATPRGFTGIFNKAVRMIGGRFTGRVEGFERGDDTGARIATEHFKWSVERFNQASDRPIEALISMMDTNTRLYGLGALRVYWKTEYKNIKDPKTGKKERKKVYDNWWVEVANNRDLLFQPGRETLKQSDYVIWRRYVSLDQLERIQEDGAGFDESAIKELKEAKTGHGKDTNYTPSVKTIKSVDWTDERFEICTTYYKDKWVTWCPKQGTKQNREALILREMANPYRHQEIPIVPLIYIPNQEDIYGMSELQPVASLLKILSALQSQYIEITNLDMYSPILASATETRIDTFKYRPKAVWIVNNPANVERLRADTGKIANFSEAYKMIVTEFLEGMGEAGAGVSQVDLMGGQKTATEVNDKAYLRGARDNFNKMMLSATLKKLMYFIFEMIRDTQFSNKDTVIKIVGQEALEYFDKEGMSDWGITSDGYELVMQRAHEMEQDEAISMAAKDNKVSVYDLAYDDLLSRGELDQYAEPAEPSMTAEGIVPKMEVDEEHNIGYLHVNPDDDYLGQFNFIPDVESIETPNPDKDYAARSNWYEQVKQVEKEGHLRQEGYEIKHKDILTKLGELVRIREADQYFKKIEGGSDEIEQAGAGGQGGGFGGQGVPGEQMLPEASGEPVQEIGGGIPQAQQQGMGGAVPLR